MEVPDATEIRTSLVHVICTIERFRELSGAVSDAPSLKIIICLTNDAM